MASSGLLEEHMTSTPEKENSDVKGNANITGYSEVSSQLPDNIKRLTPIENVQTLLYHNQDYLDTVLNKANKGDTFFPGLSADEIDTPSPSKSQSKINFSTPLQGYSKNADKPIPLKFKNMNRNIFNMTPEIPNLKSVNPVKNAFNVFDKNHSFVSGSNTSFTSRNLNRRKRLRANEDLSHISDFENQFSNIILSKDSSYVNISKSNLESPRKQQIGTYECIHSILSNPQCISNITVLIQIVLNLFMIIVFAGFGIVAFMAIKRDVDRKILTYVDGAMHEINTCRREYLRNNCAPEMRVPALEYKCNDWDTCMNKDPKSIITSMAYFEVLADCMNAFFHTISLKSLLGIGCLLLFCILVPNLLFNKFRSTTILQNYYSSTDNLRNTQSPLHNNIKKIPTFSPQRILQKQLPNTSVSNVSSVRFNPNVSYSFYECESNEENSLVNKPYFVESKENSDSYEEDLGNERIIMEEKP